MKNVLTRFLAYFVIIAALDGIFTQFDTGGPLPNSTLTGKLGFYVGYFVVGYGLAALVFEGIYRAIRWNVRYDKRRRQKPVDEEKENSK